MLKVDSLSFSYGERTIFNDLDFFLKKGKIVCVVGASGTGKSTLLKCLAGFLQPSSGKITFEGMRVYGAHEVLVAGHEEIALVNQDFALDLYHTVLENIRNIILNLDKDERDAFVEELIDLVDLSAVKDNQAIQLSGGEQQRLSLARALAKEPKVLLLDEPFAHLDIHLRRRVGKYIRMLSEIREMSVILVTHEGEEALSWADDLYFFNDLNLNFLGNPEEVYQNPSSFYQASFFGEVNETKIDQEIILFRPANYSLERQPNSLEVKLSFMYVDFRGSYYANYFKDSFQNNIVLYANKKLTNITACYVEKKR